MSFALLIDVLEYSLQYLYQIALSCYSLRMKRSNTGFYKGLAGFSRANERLVYEAAEHSVYKWWWAFLRLSPVIWYAQHTGHTPVNAQLATVCAQAGDLSKGSFMAWWQNTGSRVFEETRLPNRLRLVDVDNISHHELHPAGQSIVLEVPLTVSMRTLVNQFKRELAQHHEGKSLNVLTQSNAAWRLYTKRYNLKALEYQYWVLVYKLLYPKIAVWRIGDRLQISPGLRARDIEQGRYSKAEATPRDKLQATTGRYLYKAQRTLVNAELGNRFPNNTACEPVSMPFGQRLHSDYLAATVGTEVGDAHTPWQQWLHAEFHEDLVSLIKRKNRFTGMAATNIKFLERFPAFVAGSSDLLA